MDEFSMKKFDKIRKHKENKNELKMKSLSNDKIKSRKMKIC